MSLLKLLQKARSKSAGTSEKAVDADPQSDSGELSADKFPTDSDDLGSELEPEKGTSGSDDDECATSNEKGLWGRMWRYS